MNCQQFESRMQDLLDRREPVELDQALHSHAARCDACAEELELWSRLARVLPSQQHEQRSVMMDAKDSSSTRSRWHASLVPAAAAAAVLVLVSFWWSSVGPQSPVALSNSNESNGRFSGLDAQIHDSPAIPSPAIPSPAIPSPAPPSAGPPSAGLPSAESSDSLKRDDRSIDPIVWWQDVQDRDWMSTTMPTVRSVKRSVAPIGRSLVRAVALLTFGGETPASGTPASAFPTSAIPNSRIQTS